MIKKNLKKRIFTSSVLFILVFLMISYNLVFGLSLIIMAAFSINEFYKILKKITKKKIYFWLFNILFSSYLITTFIIFFYFSKDLLLKIILFYFLFVCIISDIGGFLFGKMFKGPKLTKISPNKTISGSIGSLVLVTVFSIIFCNYLQIKPEHFFGITIISLFTSILCQAGDLSFSYLKRKAKIKDTGNIFPGHGGILDRLDGILLGVPVGFLLSYTYIYLS